MDFQSINSIYQSINSIYQNAFDSYINSDGGKNDINSRNFEEIEQALITGINFQIATGTGKKKYVTSLPPYVIALLMAEMYKFKKVMFPGNNKSGVFSMYQEEGANKGLYVDDDELLRKCIRKLNRSIKRNEIAEVIDALSDMTPKAVITMDMDLIPVNNGIFNYKTKKLMPFSPDYVFTAKSNVDYVAGAVNPVIRNPADNTVWDVESWIADLSDDKEIVALLWQVIGAVIRPGTSWDKAILLYNEDGNNGKGSLCELLRNICGEGRYTSISIKDFSKPFMLEDLRTSAAVIVDENATRSYTEAVDIFKSVITGDLFKIDRKYEKPIDIRFTGVVVQCINDLPKLGDKTSSVYRRLLLIPFTKCFNNVERKYIKHDYLKRKEVLEYVLYKVLNMNYYEFDEPKACKELLRELKGENDNVRQFLDDILPRLSWKLAPWEFLYELFGKWMKRNNPAAIVEGIAQFRRDVRNAIKDYPEWRATNNPVNSSVIKDVPEPLTVEYCLEHWRNSSYRGLDRNRQATPIIPNANYRGLYRG